MKVGPTLVISHGDAECCIVASEPKGALIGIFPRMDRSPETDMLSELPRLEWRKMECLLLRSTKELTWVAL